MSRTAVSEFCTLPVNAQAYLLQQHGQELAQREMLCFRVRLFALGPLLAEQWQGTASGQTVLVLVLTTAQELEPYLAGCRCPTEMKAGARQASSGKPDLTAQPRYWLPGKSA